MWYMPDYLFEALIPRASDLTLAELNELDDEKLDRYIENLRQFILKKINRKVPPFSKNLTLGRIIQIFQDLAFHNGAFLIEPNDDHFNDGILFYNSQIATAVNHWFFSMFETPTKSGKDPLAQFHDPAIFNSNMKSVIRENKFKYQSNSPYKRISETLTAFRVIRGSKPVYNWSPEVMKFACINTARRLMTSKKFLIYDPCMGWGGRLVGALSLTGMELFNNVGIVYAGTDVNISLQSQYDKIIAFWKDNVTSADNFTFIPRTIGAENILEDKHFSDLKGKFDVAVTSPPYYNCELYDSSPAQSFVKFPNYDYGEKNWRDNFLRPLISNVNQLLRPQGEFWLNVADVRNSDNFEGSDYIELERDAVRIAKEVGFFLAYKYYIKMPYLGLMTKSQRKNAKNSSIPRNVFPYKNQIIKVEPLFCFKKRS